MGIADFLVNLANIQCANCSYKFNKKDLGGSTKHKRFHLICPRCSFIYEDGVTLRPIEKKHAKKTKLISVSELNGIYQITYKWFIKTNLTSIFINILIVIAYFALTDGGFEQIFDLSDRSNIVVWSFALLAILFVIYRFVLYASNTTIIQVHQNFLMFWTAPIPLPQRKTLRREEILNFSVERTVFRSSKSGNTIKCHLFVILKNKKKLKVCPVTDLNEGWYIENLLEDKLGLTDDSKLDKLGDFY
jgi:hypothetical protein